MKKLFWLFLLSALLSFWAICDTVALRGTNTIARGTNYPPDVALTGKALLMSISQPMPPPLPLVTNRARLKQIHDNLYEVDNIDMDDEIFSRNKPTVTQKKGGWSITFRGPSPQAP